MDPSLSVRFMFEYVAQILQSIKTGILSSDVLLRI